MDLSNVNFIELLPAFMREDEANIGLSEGINKTTAQLYKRIKLLSTWDQIDNMEREELDLLAEELNISWYDKNATLDVKRSIIKTSDLVHAKLGTDWAVLMVLETYFGESEIVNWYDYGGEPGHFKIQTVNQSILNKKAAAFMKILQAVKRQSAYLDTIELVSDGRCGVNVFIATVLSEEETYVVKR